MKKYNNKNFSDDSKIWLYGTHAVSSALKNPIRNVYKILVTPNTLKKVPFLETPAFISKLNIVTTEEIDKITLKDSIHQGIACLVSPLEVLDLEPTIWALNKNSSRSTVIILDQVTDTRNIGAIIRSAVAFNVDALIFTKRHAPKENSLMNKSSCGGIENIKLVEVTNLQSAITFLKAEGYWIIGLDAHTNVALHEISYTVKTALVLGSEDTGMRDLTKKSCDFLAKIPMNSQKMESLNISNASAIALYEIFKYSNNSITQKNT